MSKTLCLIVFVGFIAAAVASEVAIGSADELNAGNGFTEKRAAAPVCGGANIYCNAGSSSGYYCFAYPATSSWSCCGCDYGARGFQCGVCPYYSQCYKDFSSPTYYRCASSGGSTLSPVGIAMISVSIFVFIVIVVVVAIIRRRRAYATVEYTPGYGATVTTQAYPYYAPPPVIVEPAPVIVSDFGYHHHHHHHSGGYGGGYAAVGFDNGGGSVAVGFDNGGGSNAAIGFSN